jgi:hypothetical protein
VGPHETYERVRAGLTTILLCLAVLSPMVPSKGGQRRDDFPLTWYPMFRGVRPSNETIVWVRATLDDGSHRPVPVGYWTPGGLTEGRAHLERAIREHDIEAFCARLGDELHGRTRGWATRAVALEIVRSTFTLTAYFAEDDPEPATEHVLFQCAVSR